MRGSVITRYVGISLVLVAVMMAVSGIVAMHNSYDDSMAPLFISSIITFAVGTFPLIFVRPQANITLKEGISIVVLSWLACCIFGIFPYICFGGEFSLVDALFESVSGFTTTGASILDDIEALPEGLLFWRASTAWVGGLGIVSLFSLIIPKQMDRRSVLSGVELSDITKSQSSKHGKSFILTMLTVYVILTAVCTVSLKLTGMRWFDAATNAMSTCSTCGFCVKNASISAYNNLAVELILIVFMTISGISFMMISSFVTGSSNGRRRLSAATKALLGFIFAGTIIMALNLTILKGTSFWTSLRNALFQICSIITTTGFATVDTSAWPSLSILVLISASLICGCSGSTSGGIKMDRFVMLWSYIRNGFRKGLNPHHVYGVSIDGKHISDEAASDNMKFVLLYLMLIIIGAVINTSWGLDLETGVSAAIACLGNVGPGFGAVGSMGNYADFPAMLKLSSSLLMIAGRLEIIPLISFVSILSCKR